MMRTANARQLPAAQPFELQRQLEDRLASHFGEWRSIVRVDRRPSPYASSFPVDELDVRFADGFGLQLVMKDLSPEAMRYAARRARPGFLYDPRREIEVYRWILPHAPDGTATWYGAVSRVAARQYWLFLERVRGLELRHVGAFSIWQQAARWAARLHRSFAPDVLARLLPTSRLLVYDEAYYWCWLERARQFVGSRRGARRVVDRIAARYESAIRPLVAMPRTLIHGEFYPCNIVVRPEGRRVRVCPVDWEMAAYAPALMDLASLATGWNPRAQRTLVRAYSAAAKDGGPKRPGDFWKDLDRCRLHLAVRMLGWSKAWQPPPQHAFNWLDEAARLADRLG
jgi:aminoglycoside phosphotransferase (APT) family kinase protein